MWYLFLYAAAKLKTYNNKGYTFKSWLLLAPISCSSLIAISRTMDYRHHPTDVIAGAVIGVLGAWWGYRQYYPALITPESFEPFSPRIPRDDVLPLHNLDGSSNNNDGYGETVPLSHPGAPHLRDTSA